MAQCTWCSLKYTYMYKKDVHVPIHGFWHCLPYIPLYMYFEEMFFVLVITCDHILVQYTCTMYMYMYIYMCTCICTFVCLFCSHLCTLLQTSTPISRCVCRMKPHPPAPTSTPSPCKTAMCTRSYWHSLAPGTSSLGR